MNVGHDLEHEIASVLTETAPVRPPEHLLPSVISSARRKRRWPRWYALVKEPTMHSDSRLTVGSPTARVAAVLAATLLLALLVAGAGIAGSRLLAADGTIVVAQDGGGTVETITEAVAMAEDGDTILVRPGTYDEAVVIDKDITVTGDGPREEIVITAPEGGPTSPAGRAAALASADHPYAILLLDTDATLSGLTLRGEWSAVHARGGAPVLENLFLDEAGPPAYRSFGSALGNGVVITAGSKAIVRGNTLANGGGIGIFEGSDPRIEANTLTGGPNIWGNPGLEAVIRDNVIEGTRNNAMSLNGPEPVGALVEGNTIEVAQGVGIVVGYGFSDGVDPVIRGNTISDAGTGISVDGTEARPTIEGNVLRDNQTGVLISSAADAVVADNELSDNVFGIHVMGSKPVLTGNVIHGGTSGITVAGGSPRLDGNTVEGAERGLDLAAGATPVLSGNTVCDNGTNLVLRGDEVPDTSGNDICPDAPVGQSG